MKIIRQSFFILLMLLGLCSLPALADHLDVFGTGKTFPADFLFKDDIPSLKHLSPNEMAAVLQKFVDALDQVESPTQSNLIHLGISYIYLLQKNAMEFGGSKKNIILIIFDGMDWQTTQARQASAASPAEFIQR